MKNNTSRLWRRRSQRVTLSMPVVVSEPEPNPRQSLERTHTLAVNRYGGLIAMRAEVRWGQNLRLTNPYTRESQACRVVYLGPYHRDIQQVGVEFTEPVSNFWNISFPVPTAKPLAGEA